MARIGDSRRPREKVPRVMLADHRVWLGFGKRFLGSRTRIRRVHGLMSICVARDVIALNMYGR